MRSMFLFCIYKMAREIDPEWSHDTDFDGKKTQIRSDYCQNVLNSGTTRFKPHLAHRMGQVAKCPNVPQTCKEGNVE